MFTLSGNIRLNYFLRVTLNRILRAYQKYAQSYAKKNNLKFKADLGSSSKKATKATKASGKAAEKAE